MWYAEHKHMVMDPSIEMSTKTNTQTIDLDLQHDLPKNELVINHHAQTKQAMSVIYLIEHVN